MLKKIKHCKLLLFSYVLKKPKPIYHIHIRKTGGSTINFAFLSNGEHKNTEAFYEELANKDNHKITIRNKTFVGWNRDIINKGNYSYAFSHFPLHELNLKKHIYTITCFRDPLKRVVSHYKMLMYFKENNISHSCMKTEGKWLGDNFDDFLNNLPKHHLLNQLYMFSKNYEIDEAVINIKTVNKVLLTENLERDLKDLERTTNWKLPISNQKKYDYNIEITDKQINKLKEMLSPEYEMLKQILNNN